MGKKYVCDLILNNDRDKCRENEEKLVKMLEKICYEFLVKVAGESKGLRMKYLGPKGHECGEEMDPEEKHEI